MKVYFYLLPIIFIFNTSLAQEGTLDQTFGDKGKILNASLNSTCHVVATQADGKIITGGEGRDNTNEEYGFLIARFNIDGTVDKSFGVEGRVILNNFQGASAQSLSSISIQSNGKIVLCGTVNNGITKTDLIIIRLNSNGDFDKSFNDNGFVIRHFNYKDNAKKLAIQTDGKIIVAGSILDNRDNFLSWFVVRYLSDGSIDNAFGSEGAIFTNFVTATGVAGILIQPDQKIIVGGNYSFFSHSYILVRYYQNGSLDSSFGTNGKAVLRLNPSDQSYCLMGDITLQSDGKILVTGAGGAQNFKLSVARFNTNGIVDSSFGVNGYSLLHMETGYSIGQKIFASETNNIVVTGLYVTNPNTGFAAVNFKNNGTPDSTFGDNGIALTGFNEEEDAGAETGCIQEDGKIIVAGTGYPESGSILTKIALVRFIGYTTERNKYVRIKHWLHHHGITWEDKPNNLINYYSIQSSINGNAFTEVARIFSNHNGGIQTYSAANNATANYRVAAVSNTGNITYSNTLSLVNSTPTIQLYPNPAKNNLTIQGLPAGTTKLTVTDISGNTRIIATANSTVYSINIAQLTSGNYLLNIKTANEVITKQFIKE